MKKLVYSCISLLLIASLAACSQDEIPAEATTGINVSLNDFRQEVTTRTVPSELEKPLAEKFSLKIQNNTTGKNAYDGPLLVDRLIPVDEGDYNVIAFYGKKDQMGLDTPAYEGSSQATVKLHKKTDVAITCRVANALMSVNLVNASLFNEAYTSFEIGIRTNKGKMGIPSSNLEQSVYFPAGTAIQIYFEGKLKGSKEIVSKDLKHSSVPTSCKAGQHIKLTLKSSNFFPEIHKVEVRQEEIKAVIPVEWLPKPRVEAEAGFTDHDIAFAETESKEAKVKLFTASALEELRLNCIFEDEAHVQYNKEYLLSNPSDKEQLEALGVILPELGTNGTSYIDFKGLVANLQTNGAGSTTVNEITIDAKANKRWSSENSAANRKFTFTCNKPEFNVKIFPGDVWTKEFTITPLQDNEVTGDLETLKSKMVYQYSDNQSTWNDITSGYTQTGLQPEKEYFVRAQYRGAITSEVVKIKTCKVDEHLNTGLEIWDYIQHKDKLGKNTWKRWFLNKDKDDGNEGWCSLNSLTASDDSYLAYRSNSGTEPTSDCIQGSKAAEIKTIGWGAGTTAAYPISIIKKVTPGELFLGKMLNRQTAEYGYHNFSSRPTGVSFHYKYYPEGAHEFMVEIILYSGKEKVASNSFSGGKQDSYKEHTLSFNYDDSKKHLMVDGIYIRFSSGDNSKAEVDKASVKPSSRHVGNKLYIDDIKLVYGK